MTELSERVHSEKQVNIVQKVTKAMELMKAHGKLGKFESTDAFVDEFQNYIKIVKRCDSDHLAECWPKAKITNSADKWVTVADAKTGDKLGFPTRTTNKNVGLILADGTPIILNYNPDSAGMGEMELTKSSSITLPVGNGKKKLYDAYTSNVTSGLAFVMDVNGGAEPNKETIDGEFHDIRSFNGANFSSIAGTVGGACTGSKVGEYCIVEIASYEPQRCMIGTTEPYCGKKVSGSATDYWAGAMKACMDINMSLPSSDVLSKIVVKGGEGVPSSGIYYSSTEFTCPWAGGKTVNFANGEIQDCYAGPKSNQRKVLCVSQ